MKKLLFGTMLLAFVIVVPIPTMAAVDINIGISLPPPIVFQAPPDVIVMPDTTDVYVVPEIDVDLFFWNGWWWRLWEGRWYRSNYYDRGWAYYNNVPSFYFNVDPGWRGYYRDHNWYGHPWNYDRIPYRRLQQNWKSWHNNRYWERQRTWNVQNYKPRPQQQKQELRQQRQQQYQQRPEVQRHRQPQVQQQQQHQEKVQQPQRQPQAQQPKQHQEKVQQPQRQPQAQQPKQQHQEKVQQPQRQPQVQQQQQSKPRQGKPEKREAEKQDRK